MTGLSYHAGAAVPAGRRFLMHSNPYVTMTEGVAAAVGGGVLVAASAISGEGIAAVIGAIGGLVASVAGLVVARNAIQTKTLELQTKTVEINYRMATDKNARRVEELEAVIALDKAENARDKAEHAAALLLAKKEADAKIAAAEKRIEELTRWSADQDRSIEAVQRAQAGNAGKG